MRGMRARHARLGLHAVLVACLLRALPLRSTRGWLVAGPGDFLARRLHRAHAPRGGYRPLGAYKEAFDPAFWVELSEQSAFDGLGVGEARFAETRGFNHKQWRKHASSARFLRDLPGLLFGLTTARVLPIISLLVVFSSVVELYSFVAARNASVPEIQLPAAPFEFTAPLLGLLLVFRTNASYVRYAKATTVIHEITGDLRSLVRQLLTWSDGETERPAAVDRIIDQIEAYHCWLLTGYLVMEEGPEGGGARAALNAHLGRPPEASLTPAQVHVLLSWEFNHLPHMTVFQRKDLDQCLLVGITRRLATCEQLLRTPIPLAYTRSLLRFLWLWLTLLPFSLVKTFTDFGKGTWWEGQPLYIVPLATTFIAIFFLSLEDIAVQLEEPFVLQRIQFKRWTQWFRHDISDMRDAVRYLEANSDLARPEEVQRHKEYEASGY